MHHQGQGSPVAAWTREPRPELSATASSGPGPRAAEHTPGRKAGPGPKSGSFRGLSRRGRPGGWPLKARPSHRRRRRRRRRWARRRRREPGRIFPKWRDVRDRRKRRSEANQKESEELCKHVTLEKCRKGAAASQRKRPRAGGLVSGTAGLGEVNVGEIGTCYTRSESAVGSGNLVYWPSLLNNCIHASPGLTVTVAVRIRIASQGRTACHRQWASIIAFPAPAIPEGSSCHSAWAAFTACSTSFVTSTGADGPDAVFGPGSRVCGLGFCRVNTARKMNRFAHKKQVPRLRRGNKDTT